jgi:hypothetical protein
MSVPWEVWVRDPPEGMANPIELIADGWKYDAVYTVYAFHMNAWIRFGRTDQ